MFPFTSPSAFALDSWINRFKSWLHSDRSVESKRASKYDEVTPHDTPVKVVLSYHGDSLSLDLPSPTISLRFSIDSDLSIDTESEFSSPDSSRYSSRCSSPSPDGHAYNTTSLPCANAVSQSAAAAPRIVTSTLPTAICINGPIPRNFSRDALLAEYSQQELVLLEFLTHSSNVQPADIDKVLLSYPPGFSSACRCVGTGDEDEDFCGVCQLLDAYMAYSLERFRDADVATYV